MQNHKKVDNKNDFPGKGIFLFFENVICKGKSIKQVDNKLISRGKGFFLYLFSKTLFLSVFLICS